MTVIMSVDELFPELDADGLTGYLHSLRDFQEVLGQAVRPESRRTPFPPTLDLGARRDEDYPFQRIIDALLSTLVPNDHEDFSRTRLLGAASRARKDLMWATLNDLLVRPLVDLLATARAAGTLCGHDAYSRYEDFQEQLARDTTTFSRRFPQAWHFIQARIVSAEDFLLETVQRLTADWPELVEVFGLDPDDEVVTLEPRGDAHNGGRRVTIVHTRGGARLVYKPRSVDGEWAYAAFADHLKGLGIQVGHARVLRCRDYGYMEFLDASALPAPTELARATGQLAAVLYLLNGRDVHFENIVVTAGRPVPVDLESILHPHRLGAAGAASPPVDAHQVLDSSVHGVGVLPLVITRANDHDSNGYYDVGFLGHGRVVAGGAFRQHRLIDPFTDRMRCVFDKPGAVAEVQGADVTQVRLCADAFVAAFSSCYRSILMHRDHLAGAIAEIFTGLRLRYLHNPTMLYAQVLHTLNSAQAAASSDLSMLLALRIGLNSTDCPPLVAAEAEAILRQDIPYFTVDSSQPVILRGSGDQVLGRLVSSPLQQVLDKITTLGEEDLARQVRLIRSAFCATVPDESILPARTGELQPPRRSGWGFADLAFELSEDLAQRMLMDRWDHLPRTWIGPLAAIDSDRPWPPGVLGYDLYTGRLGIGLALARAARALDDPGLALKASQLFDRSAEILSAETYEVRNLGVLGRGAWTGLTGVLWALWAAGRTLERRDWCRVARNALPKLWASADAEPPTKFLDVIAGTVGTWAILAEQDADGDILTDARARTTRLITSGEWLERPVANQSGFAHGAAGLLFQLSRSSQVRHAAIESVLERLQDFEEPAQRNWRTNTRTERTAHGWCHGRAGVLLGLGAAHLAGHEVPELTSLIELQASEGIGFNLTHCHGDLGNHDVLRWLISHCHPELGDALERVRAGLTPQIIAAKTQDAHSRYALNDGLMVGTAGVLLHASERVDPSLWISPTTLEIRS